MAKAKESETIRYVSFRDPGGTTMTGLNRIVTRGGESWAEVLTHLGWRVDPNLMALGDLAHGKDGAAEVTPEDAAKIAKRQFHVELEAPGDPATSPRLADDLYDGADYE